MRARVDEAAGYLKVDELRARQPQLEAEASRPDLWDDPDKARRVTSELAAVNDDLGAFEALSGRLDDAETLYELARDEADDAALAEVEQSWAPSMPTCGASSCSRCSPASTTSGTPW